MNNFVNYKYNEVDYAELIYNKGFQTKHKPTELKLVLVYVRDEYGKKGKELKQFAEDFCKEHVSDYDKVLWFKTINKAVAFAQDKKNRLINVEKIEVSQKEVDYIESLPVGTDYKKLFFAFLIQFKLNKVLYEFKNGKEYTSTYFKGGVKKYNDIKKMANITSKIDINGDFIREMSELGYISIYYNGLIKHLWMDDCVADENTAIVVKDFENVGYYLDYYCGVKGMKLCKQCGQPFMSSQQCKTYCKKHKQYYNKMETKIIKCDECGKDCVVPAKATKTTRCADCQKKRNKKSRNFR